MRNKNGLEFAVNFSESEKRHDPMVPLEFEHHMQSVIGWQLYRELIPNNVCELKLADIKKVYLKYIQQLSHVFEMNGQTADAELQDKMNRLWARTKLQIKKSKTIEELNLLIIATLGDAYFDALGGMKYTMNNKVRRKELILNAHRSITYSQTIQQRACQIFDLLQDSFKRDDCEGKLEELKVHYRTMKADEFARWAYVNYCSELGKL